MASQAVLDLVVNLQDKASQGLDNVAHHGSLLQNALSFATGGLILKGIEAIGGAMGGLVDGMIDGNAEFETYNSQFTVLMKDAGAAKDRLAELAKFGQTTPFELPEVVRADKVLLAFGLDSEKTADKFGFSGKEIRTIAGDVASGVGASFEEMANLMGRFSSGATGEAIQRMAELGIATKEDMAKMGIEFSKSGQMMSPLPEATEKVLQLMKDKFGGMMDVQSKTFDGMISNLRDWAGETLRIVGQPIFKKLEDGLQSLLVVLSSDEVKSTITNIGNLLADGIATGANIAGIELGILGNIAADAGRFFGDLLAPLSPIKDRLVDIADIAKNQIFPAIQKIIAGDVTDGIKQLGFAWDGVKLNLDDIGRAFSEFVTGIADWVSKAVPETVSKLSEWGQSIWNWLTSVGLPTLGQTIADWSGRLWVWVTDAIPRVLATLQEWGGTIWNWLTGVALPTLTAKTAELSQKLWIWVQEATASLKAEFDNNFLPAFKERLDKGIQLEDEWVQTSGQKFLIEFPDKLDQALDQVDKFITDLSNMLLGKGKPAVAGAVDEWGATFLGHLGQLFVDVLLKIPQFIEQTKNVIAEHIASWIGAFISFWPQLILKQAEQAQAMVAGIIASLIKGAEDLAKQGVSMGGSLAGGIVQGLGGLASALFSKLWAEIQAAIAAVRAAIGAHSPALYSGYRLGVPIGEGVTWGALIGLRNLTPTLIDGITRSVNDAANATAGIRLDNLFGGSGTSGGGGGRGGFSASTMPLYTGGGYSGDTIVNYVTVNAGAGTNGTEIGEKVAEAISRKLGARSSHRSRPATLRTRGAW